MLGIEIQVVPVRGQMWATEPLKETKVKTMIFSADAASYWDKNNMKLME